MPLILTVDPTSCPHRRAAVIVLRKLMRERASRQPMWWRWTAGLAGAIAIMRVGV